MSGLDMSAMALTGEQIYESALDPTRWRETLETVSKAYGAMGIFISKTPDMPSGSPNSASVDPILDRYWGEGWNLRDTRIGLGLGLSIRNGILVDQDFITPEGMATDPFYQEMLAPSGLKWFGGLVFQTAGEVWAASLQRTPEQGPFNRREQRAIRDLRQHMQTSAWIGRAAEKVHLKGLFDGLNLLEYAAAALDGQGKIIAHNDAFSSYSIFDDVLLAETPTFNGRRHRQALLDAISSAANFNPRIGNNIPPILIKREDKEPLLLACIPFPRTWALGLGRVRVIVLVKDLGAQRTSMSAIQKSFGLTPRESLIAQHLLNGDSLSDAANALGITRETAKTHLRSVFTKTDTAGQSALIALLGKFSIG